MVHNQESERLKTKERVQQSRSITVDKDVRLPDQILFELNTKDINIVIFITQKNSEFSIMFNSTVVLQSDLNNNVRQKRAQIDLQHMQPDYSNPLVIKLTVEHQTPGQPIQAILSKELRVALVPSSRRSVLYTFSSESKSTMNFISSLFKSSSASVQRQTIIATKSSMFVLDGHFAELYSQKLQNTIADVTENNETILDILAVKRQKVAELMQKVKVKIEENRLTQKAVKVEFEDRWKRNQGLKFFQRSLQGQTVCMMIVLGILMQVLLYTNPLLSNSAVIGG